MMPQSFVQHMQSMAAAMAELTRQNQELTREINLKKQHYEGYAEGHAQSQEDGETLNQKANQGVPHPGR